MSKLSPQWASTYQYRSKDVSSRLLLNCFVESTQNLGKSEVILLGTPGQRRFADFSLQYPASGCRGLHWTSTGRFFAVFGGNFVEVLPNGTQVPRFSLTAYPTEVSMASDGIYLVFVDGFQIYYMDLETNEVFAVNPEQIDFDRPTKVVYANGRVVVINADDTIKTTENQITRNWNRFYWSELRDIKTFNPLNFATAEQSADRILAIEVRDNDLLIIGPESYELWRSDNSDPDLPFVFAGGASEGIGIIAPYSSASFRDSVIWLGGSASGINQIYKVDSSGGAKSITPNAISSFLAQNTNLTQDAYGFIFQQENHTFYVLTFNQLNKTFVYDLSTEMWHERSTRDERFNLHNKWRVRYATFAFNRVIVADNVTATLYTLDLDKYDDDLEGNKVIPIVRILQSPQLYDENNSEFLIENFELDLETGASLNLGQGQDAQIMLQLSKDGGYSWGSEIWKSIGKIGETKTRVQWRALGRARELTVRLTMSDPVRFCLISSFAVIKRLGNRR